MTQNPENTCLDTGEIIPPENTEAYLEYRNALLPKEKKIPRIDERIFSELKGLGEIVLEKTTLIRKLKQERELLLEDLKKGGSISVSTYQTDLIGREIKDLEKEIDNLRRPAEEALFNLGEIKNRELNEVLRKTQATIIFWWRTSI